jgi:hypothetical protein
MPAGAVAARTEVTWSAIKIALKAGEISLREALRHPACGNRSVWDLVALSRLTGEYGPTAGVAHQVMEDMRNHGIGPMTKAIDLNPGLIGLLNGLNRQAHRPARPL